MSYNVKLFVLVGVLIAAPAWAQTVVNVSLSKARITWEHDLVNVDNFTVVCGIANLTIAVPALEAKLSDFITAPGSYTCRVVASNQFGASPPSDEVSFNAGDVPNAATSVRLTSP